MSILTPEPATSPVVPPPVSRRKHFTYMIGRRSGKLVVNADSGERGAAGTADTGCVMWECKCDCGRTRLVATHALKMKTITHCGKCDPIELESAADGYIVADGPVRRVSDIPFMPSPLPVPAVPPGAIVIDPFPVGFFGRLRKRAALWLLG